MRLGARRDSTTRADIACGVLAGPVFVAAFTAIGARRAGYDWRRHPVSALALGAEGWMQRASFMLTGLLYCRAARGLASAPSRVAGPRAVPVLVLASGVGLIGSGVFVTDPVAGFPPTLPGRDGDAAERRSREGALHNLCAIPIFVGIPVASLTSACSAIRCRERCWACYSATSGLLMTASFVLFGAAFGGKPRLAARGGVFQRLSILIGFGWLTALSLRALARGRRDA